MTRPDALSTSQAARTNAPASPIPSWADVEDLLDRLAETGETIPIPLAPTTRISTYQRGGRIRLESDSGSNWLAVDDIRECWETFERLGRIRRQDVLDPGRCSAFMIALFRRVPGVTERAGKDLYLVMPS